MNIEHGAFYNLEYILAGCLMDEDERKVVSEVIAEKEEAARANTEEGNDEDALKDVSILDKAFPLVMNASMNPSVSSLAVAKSESFVGEVDSKVQCSLCDSRLAKSSLSRHLKRVHKLEKEQRDLVFKSMSNIGNEDKSNALIKGECGGKEVLNDESQFAGKIHDEAEVECDIKSDSKINVDEQKYKCPFCDTVFTRSKNLKRHVVKQHPETEDIKCQFCEYTCKEQKSLKFHISSKHKGKVLTTQSPSTSTDRIRDISLKCELCKYSCTKESSLKIHKTMKHKPTVPTDKFEEKLLISQSLFKKRSKSDEGVPAKECNRCNFTANSDKELRRHRFLNHRHELMKKEVHVKEETSSSGENLLIEGPAITLDLNDVSIEMDENELDKSEDLSTSSGTGKNMLSKEEHRNFNEKKMEVVEKSEYFKNFPKNLLAWTGREEDLVPGDSLPPSFGVKNSLTSKGRKYVEYVTPNRLFKLRSMKAVLEYMKICEEFTEEEIKSLEVKLKVKTL